MQFEKTLFKVSFKELFLYFALMLILINVPIVIFTWIKGNPRLLLYESSWITQFIYPFIFTIIQTVVNRNGNLKIIAYNDLSNLLEKLDTIMLKKGFIAVDSNTENKKYIRKTKLDKLFNSFQNQNINIKITDNEVSVFARKNMLDSVKMKLKFNTF